MSIRQRKERGGWEAYVKVGGRRARRFARTAKEAREIEARLRHELAGERTPERGLEEALARYLTGEATRLRDRAGQLVVARALRPYLEGKTLADAGGVADALKRGGGARGLTNSTINRRLALLRRLCNLAHLWGWTEALHGKRVKLLAENPAREVYLSIDEVERLADACEYAGDAVRLAAYTGLRRGELMTLTPAQVRDGALVVSATNTKSARPRVVPLPERVAAIASRLPFEFTMAQLRIDFERARERVRLKHVRFHDLRHTYASLLLNAGVSLKEISELLGHSSTAITEQHYAHLQTERLRKAVSGALG